MSLTGSLFLGTILVLTVVAFVGVIVLWPRLTGRSPLRVAARVGALLGVNLLVLLTAATQLNAAYLFFASWGDLQGAVTGHVAQTSLDRGGQASDAVRTKVGGHVPSATDTAVPTSAPGVDLGGHGLESYTVHGAASGLSGQVLVQLPAGYDTTTTTRYPVIEAFHGYPSEPLNWVRIFHIGRAIQTEVDAHRMRPTIVVMPQIEFPGGVDTEGVNGSPGRPQVETWLDRDVPDWVAHTFRVQQNRDAWAAVGYSAGGWDAAMSTILHPSQFGAGIVLGGYFRPEFGPFYDPYPRNSPLERRYDLPRLVARHSPPVALWVETSHADAISYTSSAAFLHATHRPMAVHAVVLQNAGHRDSVWIGLLPQALSWLGSNVSGFRP